MTLTHLPVVALREIAYALDVPISGLDLCRSLLDNGGTSLSLVRLHYGLQKLGINISLERMVAMNSITMLLECAVNRHVPSNDSVSRELKRKAVATVELPGKRRCTIGRRSKTRNISTQQHRYPMTEMQLSLLQSSLAGVDSGTNIICYHETHSPEMVATLKEAWSTVLRAVPLLNSKYELEGTKAYIVESDNQVQDWKEIFVTDEESYVREIEDQSLKDASFGSSFRVITLRPLNGNRAKSRVIWRIHHALIDGYSHSLLVAMLENAFRGLDVGTTTPFAQFKASLDVLEKSSATVSKAYWERQEVEHPQTIPPLLLPHLPRTPASPKRSTNVLESRLNGNLWSTICTKIGVTLPALYHAAWAITLSRYSDSDDVCFGAVMSGRALPIPGIGSIIGPTINTLPFHMNANRKTTFADYVKNVFQRFLELSAVQWSSPSDGFSRDFETALNIRHEPQSARRYPVPIETPFSTIRSNVPLQVEIVLGGSDLIRFHYHTDRFTRHQVEQLSQTFTITAGAIENRDATVESYLAFLDDMQRHRLGSLGNWHGTETRTKSHNDDLAALFSKAAQEDPSETAIKRGEATMTYKELSDRSSQAARRIAELITPGEVICVQADRSFEWIILTYAVLKAGGVYCPLAEDLPPSVRDSNFVTSGARLFLVGRAEDKTSIPSSCKNCMSIEELDLDLSADEKASVECFSLARPDAGAYLCFTSGSTGKPKGVLCRHNSLVAFQRDFDVRLRVRPGWKVAQLMSPAFDGSIHEIFSTLSYGGTLVLRSKENPLSHLNGADAAILTPSVARALHVDNFPNLKVVYFVGEAVTQELCDTWASKKVLFNMYGPTETTCGATIKRLHADQPVTLGTPNPSCRIYILDKNQRLSPQGAVGEIYIAGIQVAAGYIGRSEETASRFFPDHVAGDNAERMYKTGDKGFWNEWDELVLVGRSDRQVKLRGFRIDLDGLEMQILSAQAGVRQVAITCKDDELSAYVQPKDIDVGKLKEVLRTKLTQYAIPRWIIAVDDFPMTAAGKRDYKMLGHRGHSIQDEATSATLVEPLEASVISALRETLALPPEITVDPDTHFSDLGATSVSFLFLSHRLSKLLERKISLSLIIHCQSSRDLARKLQTLGPSPSVETGAILGASNISPIEMDWWHKYQVAPNTSAFNVSLACKLGDSVNTSKLVSAWNEVLAHYKILSCNYYLDQDRAIKRSYQGSSPEAQVVNEIDLDYESHVPFNLEKDRLIRVLCSASTMLVVVSHIICDLTTLNVLLKNVADVYTGLALKPVRSEYSQTRSSAPPSSVQRKFWCKYLESVRPAMALTTRSQKRASFVGDSHTFTIPKSVYLRIKSYAATHKVTMHQVALGAVALALQVHEEDTDVVIGAPYLNRNWECELETVGLFLQPLPVRIKYPIRIGPNDAPSLNSAPSYMQTVQLASREALSHALPFDQLLSTLGITPTNPDSPLLDVMVTFHEAEHMPVLPIPDVEPVYTWTRGAKFKLMAEFSVTRHGDLMLRLEYSTECLGEEDVEIITKQIVEALQAIVEEESFADAQMRVRQVE